MAETKLDRVAFEDCRMRESMWSEVKLPKARFDRCDLAKAAMDTNAVDGVGRKHLPRFPAGQIRCLSLRG